MAMEIESHEKDGSVYRHAECTCSFCGKDHESTIAKPKGNFEGREETVGLATDEAVADALGHIQEVAEVENYQKTYTDLINGLSVSVEGNNSSTHSVSIKE